MLYATVRQRKIHVKNPVTVIQNGIGVDWLILDMDDEWKKMTSIICVFTNGETAKEMLHEFGKPVQVPWECLAETGLLSVSCTGYMQDGDDLLTMTTMQPDSFWNVVQNGPVTGDTPMEPTPTLYEQVLAAAGAANSAARQATEVSAQLLEDKENGVFDGEDGISPTVKVGTVTTGESGGEAQVHQSGTGSDVILNFVIPRGLQGIRGPQGLTGAQGPEGKQGIQGEPGVGFTDQVKVEMVTSPSGGGYTKYTYYLTDGSTREITVHHGMNGAKGNTGNTGSTFYPTVDADGNLSWELLPSSHPKLNTDTPETVNIRGAQGEPGHTPVKGVDYFTAEELEAVSKEAADVVDGEIDTLNAQMLLKADNLFFDTNTNLLYLTSNGEIIGDGVAVSVGGSGGGVDFTTDETLTIDPVTKVLSVNTADAVEQDNTLPITSAAVFTTVGNISAILDTI